MDVPKKEAQPEVRVKQDPSLAGQTLLGEDDLLDELAAASTEANDPLDGRTMMDEVVDVEPMEEPKPGGRGPKEGEIVTVFKGEAWDRAEQSFAKEAQPPPHSEATENVSTLGTEPRKMNVIPLVVVMIGGVVLALVFFFMIR